MVECRALSLRGGSVGTCVCVCVWSATHPPTAYIHTTITTTMYTHTEGMASNPKGYPAWINWQPRSLDINLIWCCDEMSDSVLPSYMKLYMYMYITLPKKVTNCCIPQVQYTLIIIIIAANVPVLAKCQIFPTAVRWPDVKITFKNND